MKRIIFLSSLIIVSHFVYAQEFASQATTAKTAYAAGKLDDSRFAMQQMLQEIDMAIGKEVIKLLPVKMLDKNVNTSNDNVNGTSGFLGVVIHRDYGSTDKNVDLEVISNSPMLAGINAILSLPLIGNSGDNKVVKIAGYRGLIQKTSGEKENTYNYDLQLPLKSTLITLKAPGYSQEDVIKMANTLPMDKIAKLLE